MVLGLPVVELFQPLARFDRCLATRYGVLLPACGPSASSPIIRVGAQRDVERRLTPIPRRSQRLNIFFVFNPAADGAGHWLSHIAVRERMPSSTLTFADVVESRGAGELRRKLQENKVFLTVRKVHRIRRPSFRGTGVIARLMGICSGWSVRGRTIGGAASKFARRPIAGVLPWWVAAHLEVAPESVAPIANKKVRRLATEVLDGDNVATPIVCRAADGVRLTDGYLVIDFCCRVQLSAFANIATVWQRCHLWRG